MLRAKKTELMGIQKENMTEEELEKKDLRCCEGEERWRYNPFGFLVSVAREGFLGRIGLSGFLTLGAASAEGAGPWLFGKAVDAGLGNTPGAWLWFALWVGVFLGLRMVYRWQDWVSSTTLPWVRARISKRLSAHAMRHDAGFFLKTHGGSLGQKVKQASQAGALLLGQVSYEWPRLAGLMGASMGAIFLVSPKAGWLIIAFGALFALGSWKMSRKTKDLSSESAKISSEVMGEIVDGFANADAARAFRTYDTEEQRLEAALAKEARTFEKLKTHVMKMRLLQVIILAAGTAIVSGAWFWELKSGKMTAGEFSALAMILFAISGHMQALFDRSLEIRESGGNLEESLKKLLEPRGREDCRSDGKGPATKGEIEWSGVSVRYGKRKALDGISLKVKAGERIGLVGKSGSGKTTLAKLVSRELDPSEGEVLIDGRSVRAMGPENLAASIAEVSQHPSLYRRSILENIRVGNPDASKEECEAAARKAACGDFLDRMPDGLDTVVGERGMKLSGGERQRVAIARAFLRNAKIVILDEATSALDTVSEAQIQEGLFKLMEGRTALVIAHRLSTVRKLDRILVMENGKIAEDGSHESLLAKGGLYAQLWEGQSGDFLENEEADEEESDEVESESKSEPSIC